MPALQQKIPLIYDSSVTPLPPFTTLAHLQSCPAFCGWMTSGISAFLGNDKSINPGCIGRKGLWPFMYRKETPLLSNCVSTPNILLLSHQLLILRLLTNRGHPQLTISLASGSPFPGYFLVEEYIKLTHPLYICEVLPIPVFGYPDT